MRCPICQQRLDASSTCAAGHAFRRTEGVLRLVTPQFADEMERLEQDLREVRDRSGSPALAPDDLRALPHGPAARRSFEWRLRQQDLANVLKSIGPKGPLRILDCGAWNGWLSHQLARRGHQVTAIEYFAGAADGIGAVRHYQEPLRAIQLDLCRLDLLDEQFDLVIVNHGLAFFTDPLDHVDRARERVTPDGTLMLLGLQFFRNPEDRIRRVQEIRTQHHDQTGRDLFFRPTRGYLDWRDRDELLDRGFALRPYRRMRWHRLKTWLDPRLPWFGYAELQGNSAPP